MRKSPVVKNATDKPIAIYIHIPFCAHKCLYCDFNSKPALLEEKQAYVDALISEIRNSEFHGIPASTIYLGGGTPNELTGDEIETIITVLDMNFKFIDDREWSIECNPGNVSPAFFKRLAELEFDRVSLGAQSFSEAQLRSLGRLHSVSDIFNSYDWIRDAGIDNINLDLIYGIPGQRFEDWLEDLREAFFMAPEHLSLYNLTIEKDTRLSRLVHEGLVEPCDEDLAADMYEASQELTERAGYQQYEISNFALPEHECRHNLAYWKNEPYLGFGLSAASYMDGLRWTNTGDWREYLKGAAGGSVPSGQKEKLEAAEALGEEIMLLLRLSSGADIDQLSLKYNLPVEKIFGESIAFLVNEGLLDREGSYISLSRKGMLLASSVSAEFLNKG